MSATHIAAAPTAFRKLAAQGTELNLSALRGATSAGEPLDSPTIEWYQRHLGVEVHDSYGLTEVGMVTANLRRPAEPQMVPGSMGVPLPGFDVRLQGEDGQLKGNGEPGHIAIRDNGFFLGSGYWGRQEEWNARFDNDWFITEDIARRDEEGRYWYIGRSDDVIVTAGYNVGPIEVETILMDYPGVVDAACVGEADPVKGQVLTAHLVIQTEASEAELLESVRRWVGERLGWHAAPHRLYIVDELPRTTSGKVQRHRLRASHE